MPERIINGFKLSGAVVTCPECSTPFHKELLTAMPPLTQDDVVEADLHRVFPDPSLRAALLGLCPDCKFCGWSTSFADSNFSALLVKKEPLLPDTKKYAVAVKCARARKLHPLDVAFIALNGLWCAREAGEDDQLWLELVAFEHSRGMDNYPGVQNEDGMAHLMMAEIWRQLKQFDEAKREYEQALNDPSIMPEIIRHQIGLCDRKFSRVTALPLHVVRQIFPVEESAAEELEAAESANDASKLAPTALAAGEQIVTPAEIAAGGQIVAPAAIAAGEQIAAPAEIAAGGQIGAPAATAAREQIVTPAATAAPKDTSETAMLNAISALLSAQAALTADQDTEAVPRDESDNAKVPTIRPARPRATSQSSTPETPEVNKAPQPKADVPQRNVAGILQVRQGNELPPLRHSHRFKHPLSHDEQALGNGWLSDYGNPPLSSSAQLSAVSEAAEPPHYDRPVELQQDPLPDFEIEGPTEQIPRTRKPAAAAAAPAQTAPAAAATSPQAQASSGQSQDHTDAIARVESYLSFSRALHTRSFMKYN